MPSIEQQNKVSFSGTITDAGMKNFPLDNQSQEKQGAGYLPNMPCSYLKVLKVRMLSEPDLITTK